MYREVSAYKTLNHPGIPRLVDTNVEGYEDNNYKLFLVTELVEGPTLEQVVADKGPLSLEDAISLVGGLLAIVEYCHQNEIVHRDIKPDNVMVANGDPTKPVLVDFGLSFNQLESEGIGTLSDEELGNRFCRLPELGPPSSAKRDPRSDVSFCAGLLLFALTARAPGVLLDEQNRMPHQRPEVRAELESRVSPDLRSALYHILDQSFRIDVRHRWQAATELRAALESMLKSGGSNQDVAALRQQIASYARRPDITAMGELSGELKKALDFVDSTIGSIQTEFDGRFTASQTNYNIRADERFAENSFAFSDRAKNQPVKDWITFRVEAVGNEMILSVTYRAKRAVLGRTSLVAPVFDEGVTGRISAILYGQIQDIISPQG